MKIKSLLIGVGLAIVIYIILPFRLLNHGIEGSGNVVKENRVVSTFHSIEAGSAFHIYVTKGDKCSLIIETDDNLQDLINTKTKDGILKLTTKGNIINPKVMNAYIVIPVIEDLDLSGACNMETEDRFESDKMEVELSGASKLKINIKTNKLELDMSGASKAIVGGFVDELDMDASGACHAYFDDAQINNADIDCSGAAKVKVNVMESLKGECSGASNISYSGPVKKIDIETSGAGSVNKN